MRYDYPLPEHCCPATAISPLQFFLREWILQYKNPGLLWCSDKVDYLEPWEMPLDDRVGTGSPFWYIHQNTKSQTDFAKLSEKEQYEDMKKANRAISRLSSELSNGEMLVRLLAISLGIRLSGIDRMFTVNGRPFWMFSDKNFKKMTLGETHAPFCKTALMEEDLLWNQANPSQSRQVRRRGDGPVTISLYHMVYKISGHYELLKWAQIPSPLPRYRYSLTATPLPLPRYPATATRFSLLTFV